MNSLQLFVSFRLKSNSVIRLYSTSALDRIKFLNYATKALYGPVIKAKTSKPSNVNKKLKVDEKTSSPLKKPVKKAETNYSSEMYWIINRKLSEIVAQNDPKILRDAKVKKESKVPSNKQSKEVSSDAKEKTVKDNSVKSRKSVNQQKSEKFCEIETITPYVNTAKKPILLSDEELRNVIDHPLQSEVVTTSPIDLRAPQFRNVPSVGKILQYTMSESARAALLNWKLSKIRELGEQGFAELQQSNLNSGLTFHWSLQNYFQTNEVPIATSEVYKLWESVRGVLDTFNAMPELVERSLFHPTLKYKGICDCVSEVQNQLTVIEWKKSTRSKPTIGATYDAPLQLCAYLGALNSLPEYNGRIRQGMIVVAYEDGKQADVYKLNEVMLRQYWRVWLGRLQEFWIRSRDGTLLEPI